MPYPSLTRLDHRPWPLPAGPWTWRQRWLDLLFAHWPLPAEALQRYVPAPLRVQEFEGTSWVGVVPFRMAGVMRRGLPDLPGISAFPELNVRLYVEHEGKPGVWFLSLDATNPLAVWTARRFFHLPYHRARIDLRPDWEGHRFIARRTPEGPAFDAAYRPVSAPYESRPGTLEHWLTERYCLYARAPGGEILRTDVHHVPWPLQRAEVDLTENTYLASHGLPLDGPPALVHVSKGVDVVVWDAVRASDPLK